MTDLQKYIDHLKSKGITHHLDEEYELEFVYIEVDEPGLFAFLRFNKLDGELLDGIYQDLGGLKESGLRDVLDKD